MKRRKMNNPASVRTLLINESSARNSWSKPRSSISHQVAPAPGLGTARKMNTTIAVPTSTCRACGSSSPVIRPIRKTRTAIERPKTSSWPKAMSPSPTPTETIANARPPPRIHQLIGTRSPCGFSIRRASLGAKPFATSRRASRQRRASPRPTPSTDTTGMISASS